MRAEDLWETTLDPARRRSVQITIKDAEEANETLENLFNSNSKYSDKRKELINENQHKVKDIDLT